jgi:hypothetical protein
MEDALLYLGHLIHLRSLALFFFSLPLLADAGLTALRVSLDEMRKQLPDPRQPRGATPLLTVAKHQLRDWVESRLNDPTSRKDQMELQVKLNAELRAAGMFCGEGPTGQPACPDENLRGFLEAIKLHPSNGFLILQTGFGIQCGFDESAYLYSSSGDSWSRIWQTEQNTYTGQAYEPQTLESVRVSPDSNLVLTLGIRSWCISAWQPVYYRVFRFGIDSRSLPLIDGTEGAYLGEDPPIHGNITRDEVLVEFRVGSIDTGVHNRAVIRHFKIEGDNAIRVDPLALSPRDFVDEWLIRDWKQAALWSESANHSSVRDWHKKLNKDSVFGVFINTTFHCLANPDLWQVGVDFSNQPAPLDMEPKGTWFTVRWRPPYRFTMVDVGDQRNPACQEPDPNADDEHRTLFPGRN